MDDFKSASNEYLDVFPYQEQLAVKKQLFKTNPVARKEVWRKLELPTGKIQKKFIKLTKARNELAREKGYKSLIEMKLEEYLIPGGLLDGCLKNIESLIGYCNSRVSSFDNLPEWFYSKYNTPCFVCRIPDFPINSESEVKEYFLRNFKEFQKLANKLTIEYGNNSSLSCLEDTGTYKITIDKSVNNRHKIIDLFHELSHLLVYLRKTSSGKSIEERGQYFREREALKIELENSRNISEELYNSLFGEFLKVYWRVLFELELYKEPDQDLSKLYADAFNRCYPEGEQEENPLYLLDFRITLTPLSTISHLVAQSEIITEDGV